MGSFLLTIKLCSKNSFVSSLSLGTQNNFPYRNKLINGQYVPELVHKNLILATNIVEIKHNGNENKRLTSLVSK